MNNQKLMVWLEAVAKRIMTDPGSVDGIAVVLLNTDGDVETSYYNCGMVDKVLISGMISQDATLEAIAANNEDDEEDEDDDD